MPKTSPTFAIAVTLSLWSGLLQAQSAYDAIHLLEAEKGFGTRALALGGSYTALADDYTAIYWNPAGLGSIQTYQIYSELSHKNYSNSAFFANQRTLNGQSYTRFRSLGLTIPIPTTRGSLVLALGYNQIVDFDENLLFSGYSERANGLGFYIQDEDQEEVFYPFDQAVERIEKVSNGGGLQQWSFGGAIALSPRFILGLTAAILSGREQYQFNFSQTDVNQIYKDYPADFDQYRINQYLQSDYRALNLKIGSTLELIRGLRVGGVVTLPSRFRIQEVHSNADALIFDNGERDEVEQNGEWEYRVTTPFYFDTGVAFHSPFLVLSASARYRDWSQTRFEVSSTDLGDADYRQFLEENELIRSNYQPTVEYHLGGEINLGLAKLRGGYALLPTPRIEETAKRDRQVFSGGLSFTLDRVLNLDITYLRSNWERESWDSYTPAGTREDITTQRILVGLSYAL